jgi:hypothetical protein
MGGNRSWSGEVKKISANETDILFVYSMDGKMYEFGPEVFDGLVSLSLGKKYNSYKIE